MALKLKGTARYDWNVELFNSLQDIHIRIKRVKALDMLESDVEYVMLVVQMLSTEDLNRWVQLSDRGWNNTYVFLEKLHDEGIEVRRVLTELSAVKDPKKESAKLPKPFGGKKPSTEEVHSENATIAAVVKKNEHPNSTKG